MQQLSLAPFQTPQSLNLTPFNDDHPTLYEQLTVTEILSPKNIPHIDTSMSKLKTSKLPSYSSKEFMNRIISHYASKEKNLQSKKHSKYMKNVIKNISTGLTKYYKNHKAIQDILQNADRNNHKVYDATDYILNQQQINLQRKYNVSLSIKYASLKEAEDIADSKNKMKTKQSDIQFSKQPLIVRMKGLMKTFHIESQNVSHKFSCHETQSKSSKNLSTEVSSLIDSSKNTAFSYKSSAASSQSRLYKKKSRKVLRFTSSTINLYQPKDENTQPVLQIHAKKQRLTHQPTHSWSNLKLL